MAYSGYLFVRHRAELRGLIQHCMDQHGSSPPGAAVAPRLLAAAVLGGGRGG